MLVDALSDTAVFVRVVERASFSRAAADLKMSKAAVSKYVSRLEGRLGARLLHRTTRRLTLTEAGHAFYQRCAVALAELAEAEQDVARLTGEPRGVLRITAPMSFGLLHLGPHLPAFTRRYPAMSLDVLLDDRMVDLVNERVDVAIRITERLADSALVARRLAPARQVLCAAPAYLSRKGTPRTPADLTKHDCFTYSLGRGRSDWRFQSPTGRWQSVAVQGHLRSNNSLILTAAALAGEGILNCPSFYVGKELADGRLVPLLPEYRMPVLSIFAVSQERRLQAPKVRAFVDFAAEVIPELPPWDAWLTQNARAPVSARGKRTRMR